jgi:hypothetical protein
MKPISQGRKLGLAAAAGALLLVAALAVTAPRLSTATRSALRAPAASPTPRPGDPIPLASVADLTSLTATVNVDVNGLIDGERAQGSLTGLLATNDQNNSRITVSGSLLGDITAQVGGSLVGLFTPSKVDLFKVPGSAYVVINGLLPICVKPDAPAATAALDELSPQGLLTMLTAADVARGTLVGEETLDGRTVQHWVIDGDAFLAGAQASSDPKLRAFGESLWSAEDTDLYVDAKTGLPVALRGSYSGEFEPMKFEGEFDVAIELTGANNNPRVELPGACKKPISM